MMLWAFGGKKSAGHNPLGFITSDSSEMSLSLLTTKMLGEITMTCSLAGRF